jgi:phosphoenolpyruvate---glycerone phosphotransferase subunit DhaL
VTLMGEQKEQLLDLLQVVGQKLIAAEKTLNGLDAAVGDGDCGASLSKGWRVALERLPLLNCKNMGEILDQLARVFMSSVGGVSGAIYATAFMRAGRKIGSREHLDLQELHEVLVAALEGIKERGEGTKIGDKTLVDALEPALQEFGQASRKGEAVGSVLEKALAAARRGSDCTIPLLARKGRASYLGERSIGHRDAGSVAICLMFEAACDFQRGRLDEKDHQRI